VADLQTKAREQGTLPPYLSHSQISTLQECPQKYFLRYVEGVGDSQPAGWMVLGDSVHKTIEQGEHKSWWRMSHDIDWTDLPIGKFFRKQVAAKIKELGGEGAIKWGGRNQSENRQWIEYEGVKMLRRWGFLRQADAQLGYVLEPGDVERSFMFDLPATQFKMIVDAFPYRNLDTSTGEITRILRDYKTGRVGGSDMNQFRRYAYGLREVLGWDELVCQVVYLRGERFEDAVQTFALDAADVDAVPGEISVAATVRQAYFDAGVWPAQPNAYCPSCAVRDHCPNWRLRQHANGQPVLATAVTGRE
jgi:hypothetical protein